MEHTFRSVASSVLSHGEHDNKVESTQQALNEYLKIKLDDSILRIQRT